MPTFARQVDAIPVVTTTANRTLLFPSPEQNQRVQNLETGAIERWTEGAWQADYDLYSSGGATNVLTYGAVGDGVTDDSAAWSAAITAAGASGLVVVPAGRTYYINGTVTIGCHFDARGATALVGASGNIVVGTASNGVSVRQLSVQLPEIENAVARATAWTNATQIGVTLSNLVESQVTIPRVQGFYTGIQVTGVGAGTVFTNVHLGYAYNNKRNLRLVNGSGWANSNNFYGGQLAFDSGIGSAVSGTRHIFLDDESPSTYGMPNANTFIGTGVEGDVVEYHLECLGGRNQFINVRWEATAPVARFSGAEAVYNLIVGGFYADELLTVTQVSSATRNTLLTPTREARVMNGAAESVRFKNATDSAPVQRIYPNAVDIGAVGDIAGWTAAMGGDRWEWKATGDTYARVYVDPANGRVYVGPGDAAISSQPYVTYLTAGSAKQLRLVNGGLALASGGGAASVGTATLVGGTVTVNTTQVHTSSAVFLQRKTAGGTIGDLTYTVVSETSFTINSVSGTDTSVVNWTIIYKG